MDFFHIMTPFLLASIGGLYTEYSGTTNVALEGYITMSAFIFVTICKISGNIPIAIASTLLIISLLSFSHGYLTIKLRANPIITGLAVNMGFFGLISAISYRLFNTKGVIILNTKGPFDTNILIAASLILPFFTLFTMNHTRYGLRLRVRGLSKKTLLYSNINPAFYRVSAIIISALLSSLAGIFLAMELRSFIPNISAGRGWISLVIIFLGRKNPLGILIGCTVFTVTQIVSNLTQSQAIPPEIILASPYILTLTALILTSRDRK